MSEAHRRHGTLVPGTIPWTQEDDELVRDAAGGRLGTQGALAEAKKVLRLA